MLYEDLTQTLRLILHDGFIYDDPTITAMVKQLAADVPSVFRSLLPRDVDADEVEDGAVTTRVVGDTTHVEPDALVRLRGDVCKAIRLPVREAQISFAFNVLLSRAYSLDYGKSITVTGNQTIN